MSVAGVKPRIDPLQLLKCLSVLLAPTGGIRSEEEVARLASLMGKFSKKLVSKCVYIQILKATEQTLLDKFLSEGGWGLVHLWLNEGASQQVWPLVRELIDLLLHCPVNLERLKQNTLPKLVKQLSKECDMEEVQQSSGELVEKWMKIVKGEEKPHIKMRKKNIQKDKMEVCKTNWSLKLEEKSSGELKEGEALPKITLKIKKGIGEGNFISEVDVMENCNVDENSHNTKQTFQSNNLSEYKNQASKPIRKKTVKTFEGKFRTAGLLEEMQKQPIRKKSTISNLVENVSPLSQLEVSAEKLKLKEATFIKPNKILPSRNKSKLDTRTTEKSLYKIIEESSSFMEALMAGSGVEKRVRRKRRLSSNSEGKRSSSATGAEDVNAEEKSVFKEGSFVTNDSLEDEIALIEHISVQSKIDEIQILPPEEGRKTSLEATEENDLAQPNVIEIKNDNNELPSSITKNVSSDTHKNEDVFIKSILINQHLMRDKKNVKWAPETTLKEYYYFQLDETERVNVNKLKFGDMRQMETMHERQAFLMARKFASEDIMEEQQEWCMLIPIDVPTRFYTGANSKEKEIQLARQNSVLPSIIPFHLMESPHEPDVELEEVKEPTLIPLEDITGAADGINDFRGLQWPTPKGLLERIPPVDSESHATEQGIPKMGPGWRLGDGTLYSGDVEASNYSPRIPVMRPTSGSLSPGYMNFVGTIYPPPPMFPPVGPFINHQPMIGSSPMNLMGPPLMNPRAHNWDHNPGPRWSKHVSTGIRANNIRTKVCQHYKRGHCKHGADCLFLHPGINGPPLS